MEENLSWYKKSPILQKISRMSRSDFEKVGFVIRDVNDAGWGHIGIYRAVDPAKNLTITYFPACNVDWAVVYGEHEYSGSVADVIEAYNRYHPNESCKNEHPEEIESLSDLPEDLQYLEHAEFCNDCPEVRIEFSNYEFNATLYEDAYWWFPKYNGKEIRDEQEILQIVSRLIKLFPNQGQIKLD